MTRDEIVRDVMDCLDLMTREQAVCMALDLARDEAVRVARGMTPKRGIGVLVAEEIATAIEHVLGLDGEGEAG